MFADDVDGVADTVPRWVAQNVSETRKNQTRSEQKNIFLWNNYWNQFKTCIYIQLYYW